MYETQIDAGCIFLDMRLNCVIYLFGRENITHDVLSKQGFFFLVVGLHNQYFWSDEMTMFQPATISCRLVLAALTAGIYFWSKKLKKTTPFFFVFQTKLHTHVVASCHYINLVQQMTHLDFFFSAKEPIESICKEETELER